MTHKGLKVAVFCLVIVFFLFGAVLFRQLNGSWETGDAEITFDGKDFGVTERIRLKSMHTGEEVWIREPEEITEIEDFLKRVKGSDPESAKGFYEGTYTVDLYEADAEEPRFSIGFGDSPAFYYGESEEDTGYPNRYTLEEMTIEEAVAFFETFLPLNH